MEAADAIEQLVMQRNKAEYDLKIKSESMDKLVKQARKTSMDLEDKVEELEEAITGLHQDLAGVDI